MPAAPAAPTLAVSGACWAAWRQLRAAPHCRRLAPPHAGPRPGVSAASQKMGSTRAVWTPRAWPGAGGKQGSAAAARPLRALPCAPARAGLVAVRVCSRGVAAAVLRQAVHRSSPGRRGDKGQVGDGGTTQAAQPARVAGGHIFVSLDAGGRHVCGVDVEGAACEPHEEEVLCWLGGTALLLARRAQACPKASPTLTRARSPARPLGPQGAGAPTSTAKAAAAPSRWAPFGGPASLWLSPQRWPATWTSSPSAPAPPTPAASCPAAQVRTLGGAAGLAVCVVQRLCLSPPPPTTCFLPRTREPALAASTPTHLITHRHPFR